MHTQGLVGARYTQRTMIMIIKTINTNVIIIITTDVAPFTTDPFTTGLFTTRLVAKGSVIIIIMIVIIVFGICILSSSWWCMRKSTVRPTWWPTR